MINVKQVLQDYSGGRELTATEKNLITQAYGNCSALNIVNFVEEIIASEIVQTNPSIPKKLIYAYVNEIKIKKIA